MIMTFKINTFHLGTALSLYYTYLCQYDMVVSRIKDCDCVSRVLKEF